jgi:hypothetical protein
MPLRNRLAVIASAAAVFAAGVTALTTAHADHQPVIVVPGRPDVPVIIDGVDATGACTGRVLPRASSLGRC